MGFPRAAQLAMIALIGTVAVTSVAACHGRDSEPVDTPQLVTAAPRQGDEIQFDSAWSGVVDDIGGCVGVKTGSGAYVLVAPSRSSVVKNSEGLLALKVRGKEYPLGSEYQGGGVALDDLPGDAADFEGAEDCLNNSRASGLLMIYDIENPQ